MTLLALSLGAFGSLIGSFLNVVVYRVPAGRSVVSPPSACGGCGTRIRPYDNVPVLSWLVLRARCRDCGSRISVRYPLVELGTALFFAAVAVAFLPPALTALTPPEGLGRGLLLAALLYLASISVGLALIDVDTRRLPDRVVLPAYPVLATLLLPAALLIEEPARLLGASLGCVGMLASYLALAVIKPGGMGLGDVKLAGVLGLVLGWLGWQQVVVGAFSAFLLGGVCAIALVLAGRARRGSSIPFGPWMLAGAWVGIFFGERLVEGYLTLFGVY